MINLVQDRKIKKAANSHSNSFIFSYLLFLILWSLFGGHNLLNTIYLSLKLILCCASDWHANFWKWWSTRIVREICGSLKLREITIGLCFVNIWCLCGILELFWLEESFLWTINNRWIASINLLGCLNFSQRLAWSGLRLNILVIFFGDFNFVWLNLC